MGVLRGLRTASLVAAGAAAGGWLWTRARSERKAGWRQMPPGAPRIVILGAGFGGLTTAIELGKQAQAGLRAEVLLIDRVNFHLFTPMLYQVATGLVEPGHVAYPARLIAQDYGFRFREGTVEAIDLDRRQVTVSGEAIPYDRLVLALGSVTNYFGNASIEAHAASLKTLGDAVAIRNRVLDAFERAEATRDAQERKRLLTFVVVGGGATGIELVSSLQTLIRNGLLPGYPRIEASDVRVVLAEAGPRLLNGMDPWLGETAARRMQEHGIELLLGNPATEVSEDGIAFKDGQRIESRTVIWAAGVRPSPVTAALEVERGKDGRLVVTPELHLSAYPDVYALGDCAWFPIPEDSGRPAPPNAQTAVRQAPVVAGNVAASLCGEPQDIYLYSNEGNLVALGQGDGVALVGPARLEGFPAWVTWRGFYLAQLMGFKNRLAVLLDWTSAYFGNRLAPRLDLTPTPSGTSARAADRPPNETQSSPLPPPREARKPSAAAMR
ncbi:MAG: NAD(P)/FAD-dependent oxidoreductase [Chloroflexi bacterium]|nr:NAD(P)/FAD-dependent oxidoreductase [Chloroflexota bacterium]